MADDLLGIGKAADAISQPLQNLLDKLLGPAAVEVGELLADRVKYFRWKNALNALEQAQREIERRGITPQKVPLKTLIPILEGASLEGDDENLQTKWSNLLASAASGHSTHPSYPKILSELVSSEAKLLDYLDGLEIKMQLLETEIQSLRENYEFSRVSDAIQEYSQMKQKTYKEFHLSKIRQALSLENEDFFGSVDNLLRLKLCEHPEDVSEVEVITQALLSTWKSDKGGDEEYELDVENESITNRVVNERFIRLTTLGKNFMKACRTSSD